MNWLQRLVNLGAPPVPSTAVQTPDWMRKALQLPPWASVCDSHSHKVCVCIDVDTSAAMREWLALLGAPEELTQYWLEVAYQCVKLDVQMAIELSAVDPRNAGKPAEFNFLRAPEYAQANFKPGPAKRVKVNGVERSIRGAELATQGLEAREHYKRIRGRLPF